jgi:hypothetical protein
MISRETDGHHGLLDTDWPACWPASARPLPSVAAAVVIDIGASLSHGLIVARELGIPCAINTMDGSRRWRTGDPVTVDSDAGSHAQGCEHVEIGTGLCRSLDIGQADLWLLHLRLHPVGADGA